MTYTIVVHRDPEGRYLVSVPALKGCHTWGDSLPEALDMAREAILGVIGVMREHGDPVPSDNPSVTVDMTDAAEAFVYRLAIKEAVAVA